MIYSSYFAFYLLLLIVWNGLQTVFDMGMKKISKRCYAFLYHDVKIIIIVGLILTYPGQIVISVFQSGRYVDKNSKATVLFIFFVFFLFLYLTTIGLILKLKRKLYDIYEDKKLSDDIVTKYIDSQGQSQSDERDKNNSIMFLKEIMQQNLLEVVEYYIFNRTTRGGSSKDNPNSRNNSNSSSNRNNINTNGSNNEKINNNGNDKDITHYDIHEESEYGIDYEKEIMKFDRYQYDINNPYIETEINSNNIRNHQHSFSSKNFLINEQKGENNNLPLKRVESKSLPDKKKKFELTKSDLQAMNKIFGMSYAFILMTIIILSFSCTLSFQNTRHSPTSILITICTVFIAEIASIGIIYSLFFRNLKSQEYQNLKIIGEIEKYMNQNKESTSKIVYKEFTNKEAFKRFKSYVKE